MIRVLLVDDHAVFRQALSLFLDRQPDIEVVAQAGTLAEARQSLGGVDVIVLDIALPDGNGFELIGELRKLDPDVAVLVLSGSIDPAYPERALEAGADAMLSKVNTPMRITDEIRRMSKIY